MVKRIMAIIFIYLCTCFAWILLGGTVHMRTVDQDSSLKNEVGKLWGTPQRQKAPVVYYQTVKKQEVPLLSPSGLTVATDVKEEVTNHYTSLDSSKIDVNLSLEHRRKGLIWYSTYRVNFAGKYLITNNTNETRNLFIDFQFPTVGAIYDNFRFAIGNKEIDNIQVTSGVLTGTVNLKPGQSEYIEIAYGSQGLDEWSYYFGENVNQAKNFSLNLRTDFDQIDFPQNSISPVNKTKADNGWQLDWHYSNLLAGVQIGMVMPQRLNPGPWVSQVSFFAPVSLFFFFFVLFIFATLRRVKIHPMNYFFIGAAFFSFHLLLAYMVDHISIHLSFLICSVVSMALVISYMRLVVGAKFATVEVGLSQFVYLVLFSYTFFFEKYTGLAITILCIATLFVVMQITGKVDWEKISSKNEPTPPIAT